MLKLKIAYSQKEDRHCHWVFASGSWVSWVSQWRGKDQLKKPLKVVFDGEEGTVSAVSELTSIPRPLEPHLYNLVGVSHLIFNDISEGMKTWSWQVSPVSRCRWRWRSEGILSAAGRATLQWGGHLVAAEPWKTSWATNDFHHIDPWPEISMNPHLWQFNDEIATVPKKAQDYGMFERIDEMLGRRGPKIPKVWW